MRQSVSRIGFVTPWVVAVALAVGCAGHRHEGGAAPSREIITREDIERTHAVNAYDAVERLRSHWLRQRGTTQLPAAQGGAQFQEAEIQVYLDDQRLGNLENLRRIEITAVQYIRFVQPAEASSRWGFGHGAGAILVSTRPLTENP